MKKLKSFLRKHMNRTVAVVMILVLAAGTITTVTRTEAASFPTDKGGAHASLGYSVVFAGKNTAFTSRFGNHSMHTYALTTPSDVSRAAFCIDPGTAIHSGTDYVSSTVFNKAKAKYYRGAIYFYYNTPKTTAYSKELCRYMTQAFVWYISKGQSDISRFRSDTISVFTSQNLCNQETAGKLFDLAKDTIIDKADNYTADEVAILKWTHSGTQTMLTGKLRKVEERYYKIRVTKQVEDAHHNPLADGNKAGIKYAVYTARNGNTRVKDINGKNVVITLNAKGVGISGKIEYDEEKEEYDVFVGELSSVTGTSINNERNAIHLKKSDIPDNETVTLNTAHTDTAWYAKFRIIKVNVGNTRLSNAVFGVYEYNGSKYVDTKERLTTNANGVAESRIYYYTTKNLGKFMVKELQSPSGYINTGITHTFTIDAASQGTHTLTWTAVNTQPTTGTIRIRKVDSKTGSNVTSGQAKFRLLQYAVNPSGQLLDSNDGRWIDRSEGYWRDDLTIKKDWGLIPYSGNGVYEIKNLPRVEGLCPCYYVVYEEEAPQGYYKEKVKYWNKAGYNCYITDKRERIYFSNDAGSPTEYNIDWENKPISIEIPIVKLDKETGQPIEGAVFNMYVKRGDREILMDQKTTDADGKATFYCAEIYADDVVLREVYAPEGYKLNTEPIIISHADIQKSADENYSESLWYCTRYSTNVEKDQTPGNIVSHSGEVVKIPTGNGRIEKTIYNEPISKRVQIHKVSRSRTGKAVTNIENAEFSIYAVDEKNITPENFEVYERYASATPISVMKTNGSGLCTSGELKLGKYVVVETKAPKNYLPAAPVLIEVDTSTDSDIISLTIEDSEFESRLRIIKKDKETGKVIARAGTQFKIKDTLSGRYVTQERFYNPDPDNPDVFLDHESTDVFTTDDTGAVLLPDVLSIGHYQLEEVKAPKGYQINTTPVSFVIDDEMDYEIDEGSQDPIITLIMQDEAEKAKIHIEKTGDVPSDYADGKFEYWEAGLQGAVFTITATEDIISPDGETKLYENGEVADIISTDADGKAVSKDLPLGTYQVSETTVPFGYYDAQYQAEISLELNDENVATDALMKVKNDRQPLEVTVYKRDKETEKLLPGAVFGIYAKEDITDYAGRIIVAKDTLLEQITTDINGTAEFNPDINYPAGEFYIKELQAPKGYHLNEDIVDVSTKDSSRESKTIRKEYTIYDDITKVEVSKQDITNEQEIEGASLEVWYLDSSHQKVVADSWISGKEPHIIKGLEFGREYNLTETKVAPGYVTASDIRFTVNEDQSVTKVTMVDDVTKVQISKTDITTGEPVQGAQLSIMDKSGNILASWTTTKKPHYIEKLPVGSYVLVENRAPVKDGYVKADSINFDVADTGEIQKVEMKDDYTKVEISKEDITNGQPVIGAKLEIRNAADETVASWTTTDTPHRIEKLPVGAYTLIETYAPNSQGYVTAENVSFTVRETGEVQKVVMKDDVTKVEITKTDMTGTEQVVGAKLTVTDKAGKVVETWTTTDKPHCIEKLPTGTYYLTEERAPKGYLKAKRIQFRVTDSGAVVKVVMKDDEVVGRLALTKVETGTKEGLAGAEFTVYTADHEAVATMTTGRNGTATSGYLQLGGQGETVYYIQETKAPDHYQIRDTKYKVTITAKDDTTKVVKADIGYVENDRIITPSNPKTGVIRNIIPIFLVGGGVCGLIATMIYQRKKNRKK